MDRFSDRGSTPLISTNKKAPLAGAFLLVQISNGSLNARDRRILQSISKNVIEMLCKIQEQLPSYLFANKRDGTTVPFLLVQILNGSRTHVTE